MKKIICFGEVLWDLLPSGKQAGGALMNVAFRLKELNHDVALMTAIGNDSLGHELMESLEEKGISDFVYQSTKLSTGTVDVKLDATGSASYTIVQGVAWDEIPIEKFKGNSSQLIFGSLALRTEFNRRNLIKLIDTTEEVVFDVNLRAPFYSFELVDEFIQLSHLVKLNEDEFIWLCNHLDIQADFSLPCFQCLSERYSGKIWCVTLGENGAILYEDRTLTKEKGHPVLVKDTIGAGDAFLAAFLHKRHKKVSPSECLTFACKVGSTVAGQKGASQALPIELLND